MTDSDTTWKPPHKGREQGGRLALNGRSRRGRSVGPLAGRQLNKYARASASGALKKGKWLVGSDGSLFKSTFHLMENRGNMELIVIVKDDGRDG